jgi:hypothetical protein
VRRTVALAAAALAAALVPLPSGAVERWYSRTIYLAVQAPLTRASSAVPFALLDLSVAAAVVGWLIFVVRRWRRHGFAAALKAAAISLISAAAVLYLVFLALWGLNYRRLPLETKLAYDRARVTQEGTMRFSEAALERVNALEPARDLGPVANREALQAAFARAQGLVGAKRPAVPGRPKWSIFSWYLRLAGIDGMMNPFFLEIILNPEVLPVEYPFSLAHEWAHLAGYADESEANFVAWLTCVGADGAAQYSGWLEAFRYAVAALPRSDSRTLHGRLAADVVADLRAINQRLGRADPAVSGFARNVYDSYLRAQGVDEGMASYGAMLRLMVGTTFENGWVPRMRD